MDVLSAFVFALLYTVGMLALFGYVFLRVVEKRVEAERAKHRAEIAAHVARLDHIRLLLERGHEIRVLAEINKIIGQHHH